MALNASFVGAKTVNGPCVRSISFMPDWVSKSANVLRDASLAKTPDSELLGVVVAQPLKLRTNAAAKSVRRVGVFEKKDMEFPVGCEKPLA